MGKRSEKSTLKYWDFNVLVVIRADLSRAKNVKFEAIFATSNMYVYMSHLKLSTHLQRMLSIVNMYF